MEPGNKRAGGCFLMGFIMIGFAAGVAIGEPTMGVLVGTGLGMAAAVGLWLLDRRNGR